MFKNFISNLKKNGVYQQIGMINYLGAHMARLKNNVVIVLYSHAKGISMSISSEPGIETYATSHEALTRLEELISRK